MSIVAIIPARGGSKRIKHKNIKNFCGQPIIKYSIDAAKNTNLFNEVIVSTDDPKIAALSKRSGAAVYGFRTKKNSADKATLADMMLEEIKKMQTRGVFADYICLIFATAPTISSREIKKGFKLLREKNADGVVTVCEFSQPYERALSIEDGQIKMVRKKNKLVRTQDMPKRYFDAGRFYWIKTSSFKKTKDFFAKNTYPLIIPGDLVEDINTLEDWHKMEIKFKLVNKNNAKR